MKLDLASAYAASLARVASWAVIAGVIYDRSGSTAFAAFSITRAIMTLIAVSGLGLTPTLVVLLPQFKVRLKSRAEIERDESGMMMEYETPRKRPEPPADSLLMDTAFRLVVIAALGVSALVYLFFEIADSSGWFDSKFAMIVRDGAVGALGATFIRLFADVAGTRLQTSGYLALDFLLQAATEICWVAIAYPSLHSNQISAEAVSIAMGTLMLSNILFGLIRFFLATLLQSGLGFTLIQFRYAGLLLRTGSLLMAAQVADLLYGPANQALIKAYLTTQSLAEYAPLLHIDAALLLGVGGLATLLLPKTAIAMGDQNHAAIRRYYVNGTLASLTLLAAGAAFAWAVAPRLFKVWFGDPLPATVALLPLVMIHTVIGGTAGVGRSILFGMNRAAAYTAASLVGGVANVGLAILLVTHTALGLRGIILATIITVVVRCAIWMPWYTLRAIRQESAKLDAERMALAAEPGLP